MECLYPASGMLRLYGKGASAFEPRSMRCLVPVLGRYIVPKHVLGKELRFGFRVMDTVLSFPSV